MELVSVVMPVYNTERYIKKTVISILNQTYDNIEIIIVDDGGTDNSVHVAEALLVGKNHRIIHERNAGLSIARSGYPFA